MRRVLSLSIAAGLALTAGAVVAQSRTVSTADMPKPGVSYISGPAVPVRKETVSTGTLPQPARLYVGGQVAVGGGSYRDHAGDGGSVAEEGYYYGGGYPPGYGWNDRDGHGRDHDHGRPGHDHDHDGHDGHDSGHGHDRGWNGSTSLAAGSGNSSAGGAAGIRLAPDRQPDRNDRGWNRGYYGNPPVQPGTGFTNTRAPQPGTGMGTGNQPGTGIPMRGGDGWRGR